MEFTLHDIGICCRLDLVLKRKSGLVNERQTINFIVNIFYHLCGLLLFYITVSPLLNKVKYYLENSYTLPLQKEFHLRFELESEDF